MTPVLLDHEYSRGGHSALSIHFLLTLSGEANTQICCGANRNISPRGHLPPCTANNKTKSELQSASRAPIDWMRNNATTKQQRDEEQSVGFDPKQRVRLPNEATILQHPFRTRKRSQVPITMEAQQHLQLVNSGRRVRTYPRTSHPRSPIHQRRVQQGDRR